MATISLGVLGVIGALLAVTAIFGMAADSVSKRLRELGIRTALGAQRKEVLQAALGRAFKLLAFVSPQDCCWEFWPAARSRPSSMTQRHATRSFWLALCGYVSVGTVGDMSPGAPSAGDRSRNIAPRGVNRLD